jgi:acyl carrier protein phosphodiesterase
LNFLAHIYLSFGHSEISIGNFMADSLKGNVMSAYSQDMQKGVILHRAIDDFTDKHPIYRRSCKRIFEVHGHYSRVIIDIFYDHYLAANWVNYHPDPLAVFAANFYELLDAHFNKLPPKTQHLFPYMKKHNWLVAYESIAGIEQILKGMHRRTSFASKMDMAALDLEKNYKDLGNDFHEFFKELIIFSEHKIKDLET